MNKKILLGFGFSLGFCALANAGGAQEGLTARDFNQALSRYDAVIARASALQLTFLHGLQERTERIEFFTLVP